MRVEDRAPATPSPPTRRARASARAGCASGGGTAAARRPLAARRAFRGRLAAAVAALLILAAPLPRRARRWRLGAGGGRAAARPADRPRAAGPGSRLGGGCSSSGGATWIVASGRRRRLGGVDRGSWSPHGKFVIAAGAAARGARPGNVRWSLTAPRTISQALWSPSGFRVAYRLGGDLRVVAGEAPTIACSTPARSAPRAWRAGAGHVLAYLSGATWIWSTSTGSAAPHDPPHVPGQIAWSADGTGSVRQPPLDRPSTTARGAGRARSKMPRSQTGRRSRPPTGDLVGRTARRTSSEVALMRAATATACCSAPTGASPAWASPHRPLAARRLAAPTSGSSSHRHSGRRAGAHVGERQPARLVEARGFPQLQGWCCPSELGLDPVHHRAQLLALALDLVVGLPCACAGSSPGRRGSPRSTRGRTRRTGSRRGCPSSPGGSRRR